VALNTNDSKLTNEGKLEVFWEQLEQLAESVDDGTYLDVLCAWRLHERFGKQAWLFLSDVGEDYRAAEQEFASQEQLALV
jgi:hypothetical protein